MSGNQMVQYRIRKAMRRTEKTEKGYTGFYIPGLASISTV
jgi:hypothetical protein